MGSSISIQIARYATQDHNRNLSVYTFLCYPGILMYLCIFIVIFIFIIVQNKSNQKLEIIQKRCIRNLCNASYNAHSDPLFKKLAIPKLVDVHKIQLCKFMFCYLHERLPTPLLTIFATNVEIHNYKTRRQFDPHVQMRHTSNIAKTFIHQSPKLWLELPIVIKSSNTTNSFSNRLKKHLISQY